MGAELEAEVRSLCATGSVDAALTAALRGYGEEVYSFLIVRMRSEDRAADVFAQASEDLWRSLRTFEWRCSLRTWFYRLARNAAARFERTPAERAERRVALSQISEIADQLRSRTQVHLRTEVKDGVQRLRERLDPDDQMLLTLRIDRDLSWLEIAQVLTDDAGESDASARRASARMRQTFQSLKARLRKMAIAEGLLDGG